jgi:hypothetical protein
MIKVEKINSRGYGFINIKGSVVIEPRYTDLGDYYEGLAGVKIDEKYGFLNTDGRIIIEPQFEDVKFYFSEGFAAVKKDSKWGYIFNPLKSWK